MLKKKNIAMVMAAATVATSVAPVFAAVETNKLDEAELIAKVQELLETKYSNTKESGNGLVITAGNEHLNSVYTITASATNTSGGVVNLDGSNPKVVVRSVAHLKTLIEKSKVENLDLTFAVVDKGHKEVDGEIVAVETNNYAVYASGDIAKITAPDTGIFTDITVDNTTTSGVMEITLVNKEKITVTEGDYQLDLNKPVDSKGNILDHTDATIAHKVVGFKNVIDTENGTTEKDIPSKDLVNLTYNGSKTQMKIDASSLIVNGAYTQEGADFVNDILACKSAGTTFVVGGVKYSVTNANVGTVTTVKDGYELVIELKVYKAGTTAPTAANYKLILNSNSQSDLKIMATDLAGSTNVEARYTKLAGEDRFATAVEVSKSYYKSTSATSGNAASTVVLVGRDAIVDGLAAAPLAAQKDAPILLTNKDEVPVETMSEIKRVVRKNSDVYIIGGENTISKEVEKQLIEEMNANIIRLEGEDRYETSLAIAEELTLKTSDAKAYVVGGNGLADAMSIAALAAQDSDSASGYTVSPIIVTPESGLTKDAKEYLSKATSTITTVDVVGGESNVSTKVMQDLAKIKTASNVTRIAGEDRSETNAKVIAAQSNINNVYVAKDGNTQLIDALAAAPIAGKNNGVIVLATNDITTKQSNAVTASKNSTGKFTLTQVGNGIGESVINKVLNILGL